MKRLTPQEQLARSMPESELQQSVISLAKVQGWLVAHFRPGMTKRGNWITPVQGDGAGFPDLVLAKDRVLYVELKTELGKLTASQTMWMSALKHAGENTFVWRPSQWMDGTIARELTATIIEEKEKG